MKQTFKRLLVPALLALATGVSSAALATVTFDSGFAGWTTGGDASIQNVGGNNLVVLTSAFTGMLDDPAVLNLSGTDPLAAGGDLENLFGIAVGALDIGVIDQATEGSGLVRTVTVSAGDVLSFDWQLATRETVGQDYAFLTVGGTVITLGAVSDALDAAAAPYTTQTGSGLSRFEYTFTTDGPVRIGFGITDIGDFSTTSALLLDNVTVVPEPSAALLGLLGTLALLRRKR